MLTKMNTLVVLAVAIVLVGTSLDALPIARAANCDSDSRLRLSQYYCNAGSVYRVPAYHLSAL